MFYYSVRHFDDEAYLLVYDCNKTSGFRVSELSILYEIEGYWVSVTVMELNAYKTSNGLVVLEFE
jgi:hypothetical protein